MKNKQLFRIPVFLLLLLIVLIGVTASAETNGTPDIDINPTTLHSLQGPDEVNVMSFNVANTGDGDLDFWVDEGNLSANEKTTAPNVDVIMDGGFEAGIGSGNWNESSTHFDSPICDVALCGDGVGSGPYAGSFWAWFGGIKHPGQTGAPDATNRYEESVLSQDVLLPASGIASIDFYLENPACDSAQDHFDVLVDGNVVFTLNGAGGLCGTNSYSLQSADIGAYADGGMHTITFYSEIFGNNGHESSWFVDGVALETQGNTTQCDWTDISWASVTPNNGWLMPGEDTDILVTFDSTGMAPGEYSGVLCITSNDPDEPILFVTIYLWIVAADMSDLPESYGHAWHNDWGSNPIWLGNLVDIDANANPNTDDPTDDGVIRTGTWEANGTGNLDVSLSGANGWVCGWIDWDYNGVFDHPSEMVVDQAMSIGTQSISFPIPSTFDDSMELVSRFRVYSAAPAGGCAPVEGIDDGEVEDYSWPFDQTAVRLSATEAQSGNSSMSFAALATLVLVGLTWVASRRNTQTKR